MEYNEEHVDDHTEVVNDGEYIAYAEADFGPFTVEFEQGFHRHSFDNTHPATWAIEGPMIGQKVETSCHAVEMEMMDAIGTWDYVERRDKEVQDL